MPGLSGTVYSIELLNICRSLYYEWQKNPMSIRRQEGMLLKQKITKVLIDNRNVYGIRRIQTGPVER